MEVLTKGPFDYERRYNELGVACNPLDLRCLLRARMFVFVFICTYTYIKTETGWRTRLFALRESVGGHWRWTRYLNVCQSSVLVLSTCLGTLKKCVLVKITAGNESDNQPTFRFMNDDLFQSSFQTNDWKWTETRHTRTQCVVGIPFRNILLSW